MAVPEILSALSDDTRRRILVGLSEGERTVAAIKADLPISQPAVSQQLKILREAGLVTVRIDAQRRFYALSTEPLTEVALWMLGLAGFWNQPLDQLEGKIRESIEAAA